MLLSNRMASIPCSSRQSLPYMRNVHHGFKKQAQNPLAHFVSQPTTGLQYFNMRVTQRLRRYRSMKRQWQEVATSVQNIPLSPPCESPTPFQDILPMAQNTIKNQTMSTQRSSVESKSYYINDYISATAAAKDNNGKSSPDFDPLHSRIQQDLIKLRKIIKTKQKKFIDNTSLKASTNSRPSGESTSLGTAVDEQENNNTTTIRKASSLKKLKPLDRVKIAGCQMRPSILPKSESTDSGLGSVSNSSSTCSQYSKQQQQQKINRQNNKTFNIYQSRVNPPPPPLPSDSFIYRASYSSKKKSSTSFKMAQSASSKQSLHSSLTIPTSIPITPPLVKQKQPSFIKQETPLPPIQRLSDGGDSTACRYTYSASSSTAIPHSMILKRNTSLLPILLQSSSCIGIQPREPRPKKSKFDLEKEQEENNNDGDDDDDDVEENNHYYHLLDYKHLINCLPKPVISIHPRYGQDDYGVLFEQLEHIRQTMPDSNFYDDYARII